MKFSLFSVLAAVALLASGNLYAQVDVPNDTPAPKVALPALPAFNPALESNGALASVDSAFPGYTASVLINGQLNDKHDLSYYKLGWASNEKNQDHWAEIDFAKDSSVTKVSVFWAWDNGSYHSSSHYIIQYWDGKDWVDAKEIKDGPSNIPYTEVPLTQTVTTGKIRFFQPAFGGDQRRNKLAWVKALVVYP